MACTSSMPLSCVWLFLFSFFCRIVDASSWRPCDLHNDYKVRVRDVKVIPDPAVRGSEVTLFIPASTGQVITSGKVIVTVYYLGFQVYTESGDLCARISCPIQAGDFTLSNSELLPGYAPPGSYQMRFQIYNPELEMLTCTMINFRVSWIDGLNSQTVE